jgi:methyl-accepting chemotaxis protein
VLGGGQISGTARFAPPHNDEVGMLVRDFNEMLDVFEELANAAHSVSKGDLTIVLERPGDLHDAFRGMLVQLQQMVGQLRATAIKQASAAADLQAVVSEQEQMLAQQSRSANEIAATVDVLASTAQEIAGTARGVLQNAEQTLHSSATMVTKIAELGAQTKSIEELLAVIREIADRSDLLALNGALEATRAGDAGRGFALVAGEMRRLAERVTRTVVDVRGRLTNIDHARADTELATRAGREIAEHTATAAREISALTAAQGDDTRRASDAMIDVAKQVIATATTTSQTRAAAGQLELHAAELERLTRQFEITADQS